MGRNGAGKSTFMRLINGLLKPTSGTIYVNNIPTTSYYLSELTKLVGAMFQNPEHQLFSNSVEEEIDFSLRNLNLNDTEFQKYKDEIINKLDLGIFLKKSPFILSGGEKKKVAIASILCRKPNYHLFDEPTVGADKIQRRTLEKIIKDENSKGKTIIIITHDTEFVYSVAKRIIIFEKGKILADGPVEEIFSNQVILDESSLVRPQFKKLGYEFSKIWRKSHGDTISPLNFDLIQNFGDLKNKIIKLI